MGWTMNAVAPQAGRIAVVTGANTGLGFDTAKALAGTGMTVVMACRDLDKGAHAQASISARYPDADVVLLQLDLGSLESVAAFAKTYREKFNRLDLLINNAGLMMPPYFKTTDGFESQIGTNYLGHFALTGHLIDLMEHQEGSRIVTLSSMAHRWGRIQFEDINSVKRYRRRNAYGQSKLACLMFAFELQRRLVSQGFKTRSVAAHPGIADTALARYFPQIFSPFMRFFFQSSEAGAKPTLYAALGADIQGGDYCGPDGRGERSGLPIKVGSSAASRDTDVAEQLWTLSETLTGLSYLSKK